MGMEVGLPASHGRPYPVATVSLLPDTLLHGRPPHPVDTLTAALTIGLVARITRLLTKDQMFYWWRAFATIRLPGPVGYLSRCAWCMSVWVAAGVGVAAYFWGDTLAYLLVALAGTASLLTGLYATWLDPTDSEVGQ